MYIEIKNLVRHFGNTKAVNNISFSFNSGDVFGFVGPNGAGKTTTLRIMATLDEPTSGDIQLDGVSATEFPEEARKLIGFMPDSLPAHADISVTEYLDFYARAYGLHGKARTNAIAEVQEFTGLGPLRNKLLKSLSKGMKQRVSVGRALIHDPKLLLMDEPAAGLDPRARIEFRELVSVLASMDKAILISSHILTELTEICNGVVIIEKGNILETGSIAEVMQRSHNTHTVAIRSIDNQEKLFKTLLEMPQVSNARIANQEIHADIDGSHPQAADLLSAIIQQNHKICEFRHVQDDLEDIFMKITKGDVQ
jgi:ABC-2 type transport system ATP-binding protein